LFSCNVKPNKKTFQADDIKDIIEYLKKEYKVLPQVSRFDSLYIDELHEKKISLEIDSLINYRLKIFRFKSLPIQLIEYDNRFEYKDRGREDFFSISLIRNTSTGKIYLDFINPDAGIIVEDYCAYSWLRRPISEEDTKQLSFQDLKSFNSINASAIFGEYDVRPKPQKRGLEAFLNDEFRFVKPGKMQLDSLFKFYDESENNRWDTLLTVPGDLFKYLTWQANNIRNQNNYGNKNRYLSYLKEQVSLAVLKTANADSTSRFIWVYKNNRRLKIRDILINGTSRSGFTYFINEKMLCFP
jgi:hypothetical protein